VKHIIVIELSIETVSEESQYSNIGADDLDCQELMVTFQTEFEVDIPEQDEKRLCSSTVKATISLFWTVCGRNLCGAQNSSVTCKTQKSQGFSSCCPKTLLPVCGRKV